MTKVKKINQNYMVFHCSKRFLVLKTLSFGSVNWIFVTGFTELIQFCQGPKCRLASSFCKKKVSFYL